jgi:putative FmdB family regulatory protein
MPTYDYQCTACKRKEEKIHRISENPEFKCPDCGEVMERLFSPNAGGFIFKGGTPTINDREKRLRKKRSEKLKIKQERHRQDSPQVQPNIAGVQTDSWADAQKMAKEAGMNHESYTPFVEKEKKKKIIV